jgi:Predicted Fe-S oxidoreductases
MLQMNHPYIIHNIELTNHCIMNCTMCPRTYAMTREQGYIDFDLFCSCIDQYKKDNPNAARSHVWLHHFGESLLHPQFDKCIFYMRKNRLLPALSLNPAALTPEKSLRLIKSNPYLLYLSLDGYDEETFSAIRGVRGQWEKSKANALYFLKIKEQYNKNIKVVLSVIDFPEKKEMVNKAREFWTSVKGVDEFLAKPYTDFSGDVENIASGNTEYSKCKTPFWAMTIAWDGRVLPCCFDYDAKYPLGHMAEKSLREIWNDLPMQSLRKEFNDEDVTCSLCHNCSSGGKWSRSIGELEKP